MSELDQDTDTAKEDLPVELYPPAIRAAARVVCRVTGGLLLIGCILWDIGLAVSFRVNNDFDVGAMFAIASMQVTVLAVWSAAGPANVFVRWSSGVVLAGGMTWAFRVLGARTGIEDALAAAIGMQFILPAVVLAVTRHVTGWRLCWPWQFAAVPLADQTRFHLYQLLIWVTLVAVTMGLLRAVLPSQLDTLTLRLGDMGAVLVILALFHFLSASPILWACFAPRRMILWSLVAVVAVPLLTIAENYVLGLTPIAGTGYEGSIWMINLVYTATLFIAFGLVRGSGTRAVTRWSTAEG